MNWKYIKLTIYHYIFVPIVLIGYTMVLIGNTYKLIGYYIHDKPIAVFKEDADPDKLFIFSAIYPSIAIIVVILCLYAIPIFVAETYLYHKSRRNSGKKHTTS